MRIYGWLTEDERLALRRWSFRKDVLELGAFEGLSTLNIAATARGLVTVDAFDGRGTPDARDTEETLWNNLTEVQGQICPVQVHKGLFSDVLPRLDRKFDRIFIDGSHDYESVTEDINLCEPLLSSGGAFIFHDYDTGHPGVVKAVDELIEAGGVVVDQEHSLVMVQVDWVPVEAKPIKVVIGQPHRDGWVHCGSRDAATKHATKRHEVVVVSSGRSILTFSFNEILAEARNLCDREGFTHFAMLHNDVVPCEGWIDILLDEMAAHKLDFISAVVPIKDEKGLTSTATDTPGNPWGVRRLTMHEVMQLPETFRAKDVPHRMEDACLLLNSGCFLMKLDQPWMHGLHFRQQDRLSWCLVQQEWGALSISEDWDFSRQLHERGCRQAATRKVKLFHQTPQCNNHGEWGTEHRDELWFKAERETEEYKSKNEQPA